VSFAERLFLFPVPEFLIRLRFDEIIGCPWQPIDCGVVRSIFTDLPRSGAAPLCGKIRMQAGVIGRIGIGWFCGGQLRTVG
jgi:hypothetical protein